jgi:hypothetical protein
VKTLPNHAAVLCAKAYRILRAGGLGYFPGAERSLPEEAEMFFSSLTRVIAIAAFFIGLCLVLLGFGIAAEFLGPYKAALARYAVFSSPGQLIDRGSYAILFALTLGTLAEISFSVRRLLG